MKTLYICTQGIIVYNIFTILHNIDIVLMVRKFDPLSHSRLHAFSLHQTVFGLKRTVRYFTILHNTITDAGEI